MSLLSSALLTLAILVTMLAIGLELRPHDFRFSLHDRSQVAIGALLEVLVPTSMAFLLLFLLDVSPLAATGMILMVACPSGIFSNALTFIGGGKLPLSMTLTALSSGVALLTFPLIIRLGFHLFVAGEERLDLPLGRTYASFIFLVIVPTALGMWILARFPDWARTRRGLLRNVSQWTLIAMLLVALIERWPLVMENLGGAAVLALVFLLANVFMGSLVTLLLDFDDDTAFTITMEVSSKNVGLTIYIAQEVMGRSEVALFAGLYLVLLKLLLLPTAFLRSFLRTRRR